MEFYIENGYRFSSADRAAIEVIAEAAIPEIRQLLPALPRNLVLKVFPGTDVIPETGETGSIASTDRVFWVVDPHWMYRHPDGRRWVGMRAGTYVADQATRRSGKSAAELVNAADILRLAGLD